MITNIQFDALAALCKLRVGSAMSEGARSVMVHGLTPGQAGEKHNTHRANIAATVNSINRAIPLVHQAITGERAHGIKEAGDAS